MPKDIHAQIRSDALDWSREKAESELKPISDFFDFLIPRIDKERLVREKVRPAFDKFEESHAISRWWCRVFEIQDLCLSDDVIRQIDTQRPSGIGIRFSSIYGAIRVPTDEDPYCVFLYNDASQKAFFVSRQWGSKPVITRLKMSDLTCDRQLEMLRMFSKTLRQWELKHPALPVGSELYPSFLTQNPPNGV